ncbi:helix-hairpin-helix domain-containing protein [uncultured Psychrosphaera sp.]|jgi:comEA protein|uniref:ComEA family DNA-binding protein n=1 Tax=uncultured Psychrosphaera sp. TaxID=1403522 RepID=UPI002603281B|nr:helix-hairpin-helix domain-containing protein [uncultured Psychrosphaera sp.]
MNKTTFTLIIFTLLITCSVPSFSAELNKPFVEIDESMEVQAKLNVNEADVSQLTKIKGLGPKKAQAIVSYISENGKLTSLDELVNIKGIGTKLVKKLTPFLTAE